LQVKLWQAPFHRLGGGPKPSSEKDGEFGHTPVSIMPTMTSASVGRLRRAVSGKPRKSHDLVVWSWYVRLWKTDTISSVLDSFCFSSSVSLAANPMMLLV